MRSECKVIGGDTRLESREDVNLAVAGDLEDGSTAIANEEVFLGIEGDTGGHTHAFGVGRHVAIRSDAINGAIEARRNVEMSRTVEGHSSGVHHLVQERLYAVVGVDLVDRDGRFLSAGCGESNVE